MKTERPNGRQPEAEVHDFSVEGMSCASCATRVQRLLADTAGVHAASVNFATRHATVEYGSGVTADTLQRVVKDAGYELVALESADTEAQAPEDAESAFWLRRVIVAAPLAVVVFILSAGWMDETWARVASAALTVPVQFWAGMAVPALRLCACTAPVGEHGHADRDRHAGGLLVLDLGACARAVICTSTARR